MQRFEPQQRFWKAAVDRPFFAEEQGLTKRRVAIEEVLVPALLDT